MDNYVEQLKQIAQKGRLAIIIGPIYNEDENLWQIFLHEIFGFLGNYNKSWKSYIRELEERSLPIEAFLRLLYRHFGESVFPLLECFRYEKPGHIHRQIASLVKTNKIAWLATTSIDNRLSLALREINFRSDEFQNLAVVHLNGEIENRNSLRESLTISDNHFTGLSSTGQKFFTDIAKANAILVIGVERGDYCWQATYGKILQLAKANKPVYWMSKQASCPIKHLLAITEGELVTSSLGDIFQNFLVDIDEQPLPEEDEIKGRYNSNFYSQELAKYSEVQWLHFLAILLKTITSRSHAYNLLEQLIISYQQSKEYRQLALCYRDMGQILLEQGHMEKAIGQHLTAMNYWAKTFDEIEMGQEHLLLGDAYWNGSSLEQSVQHYGESLSIYCHLNKLKEIVDVASKLAYICDEDNDYELAQKYYLESLEASRKLQRPTSVIVSLFNLSTNLIKNKYWDKAKGYLEEAVTICEKEDEVFYLGEIYQHLGLIYMNLQDYETARKYYVMAYDLYTKLNDKLSLTFVYCSLGHVCVRLKDYDAAVGYYEGTLETYEKMGDWQHLAAIYNNLGFVNSNRQNHPLAEEYFSRAAEIFAALGDVYNLIRAHSNLSRVYTLQGEIENAAECYKANMEMLLQLGEQEELASTMVALAMIQLQSQQFQDAISHLQKAVSIYESLGLMQEKEETYKIIQTIKTNIIPVTR